MPPTSSELLDYLGSVHARTRRVVLCIPPDDVEWTPKSGRFTLGDIVRHVAAIERYMYAETVQGRPSRYAGCGSEWASGLPEVIAFYDRLHEESRVIFGSLSNDALLAKCTTPAGTPITTWKWMRAMFEHEAHHRGQLYEMLGLLGVPTPLLYGLTSEELIARSKGAGGERAER